MNYSGSFRKLLGNSKSAVVGAIEIYNKPNFEYRDEVFVVLLINGWELLLKAIISKSKGSIYYRKRRGQPYRTLSLADAFRSATSSPLWPHEVGYQAVGRNLEFLTTFRDNAVHFYNSSGFSTLIYLLAQTSITNYHDLLMSVFDQDLTSKINWQLLPLGLTAPIDPISYLKGTRPPGDSSESAVDEFLRSLSEATEELETSGIDSSRLMTIYDVSLNSVKKISSADIVVGVDGDRTGVGQVLVTRRLDPNRSHPLRQKGVLERIKNAGREDIGPYQFQAIVWKKSLKDDARYCWTEEETKLSKWSEETVAMVLSLQASEIVEIQGDYANHQRAIQRQRARQK